jgi:hypothetical protein
MITNHKANDIFYQSHHPLVTPFKECEQLGHQVIKLDAIPNNRIFGLYHHFSLSVSNEFLTCLIL